MKEQITKEVAKAISNSFYEVLMTGYEEEKERFPITMIIIDSMTMIKEKGIVCNLDDIFISTFLDKMYVESEKYIGK